MDPVCQTITQLQRVLDEHHSLNTVLDNTIDNLMREWIFGVLRFYNRLYALAAKLLDKPEKVPREIQLLMCLALYQLMYMRTAEYAVVNEAVKCATSLEKPWFGNVLNACLRRFLRDKEKMINEIDQNDNSRYAHPHWFIRRLKKAYPDQWRTILTANNIMAPLTLRVNKKNFKRNDYLELLQAKGIAATASTISPQAILLEKSCDVTVLPGYQEGHFAIQDQAPQLASQLLALAPGLRVLDACAAPGGKTAAIFEACSDLSTLIALDNDNFRIERMRENFARLKCTATVCFGDASNLDWWDGVPFDRILCDVPCSATGVIRRHPDIKWLRHGSDIDKLIIIQRAILENLWKILKPGGVLLYATCSVLPAENHEIIGQHCQEHPDAVEEKINAAWGIAMPHGRQILPGENGMDGFYYAVLKKPEINL